MSSFAARRTKLRNLIDDAEADALLVTNFKNVTYLTGIDTGYYGAPYGIRTRVTALREP